MEKKELKIYDLKRVIQRASKEFGNIIKGTEDDYNPQLDILEHNIYEIREKYKISDWQLRNVISMVIYDIKGLIEDKEYDYQDIASEEENNFARELRYLFNPFENKEIKNVLINIDLNNKDDLIMLFSFPIKCLLRIYDSIEFWNQRYGNNGYFRMLEEMVLPRLMLNYYPFILENRFIKEREN